MPVISVITPLHESGNQFIEAAYRSLKEQTLTDWEWMILENHGGKVPATIRQDSRVRVFAEEIDGIGALKRHLCCHVSTDYVVEFDCDDLLAPTTLDRVFACLESYDFCYSDFCEFRDLGNDQWQATWKAYPYGARYGWKNYPVNFQGRSLIAMKAPEVTPQNIRLVEWAPNHIRAWRLETYNKAGGHDPKMPVADDHDLIVRMYLSGASFGYIPECLYFYRVHSGNTVSAKNPAIRSGTWGVYNRYIWKLAEKFADDNGLMKVDLCGALDCPAGYTSIDRAAGAEIMCDLEDTWALPDGSVGVLRANDAIEHLVDPIHTMNEAYRVLAPGGFFMISVPSTSGKGAFCDPTHVSYFNDLSFRYYTNREFSRYIPSFKGKFQQIKLIEWYPSDWHRKANVPYVESHMVRLGDGYRPMGEVLW